MQATEAPADRQPSPLGRSAAIKALAMDPSLAQKLGKPEREVEGLLAEEYDRIGWLRFYLLRGWWKPRYGLDELDLRAAREEWSDERFELEVRAFQSREIDRRMIVDVYKACLRGVNWMEEILRRVSSVRLSSTLDVSLEVCNQCLLNDMPRICRPTRVSAEETRRVLEFAEGARGDANRLVQCGTATFPSAIAAWLNAREHLQHLWEAAVRSSSDSSMRHGGIARLWRQRPKLAIEWLAARINPEDYVPILQQIAAALNEERAIALSALKAEDTSEVAPETPEETSEPSPPARVVEEPPAPEPVLSMTRRGQYWDVKLNGKETGVDDTLGVRQLAHLIQNPGESVDAYELHGLSSRAEHSARKLVSDKQIDKHAWKEIDQEIRECRDRIERAKQINDEAAADRASRELEALQAQVRKSTHNGKSILDLDDIDLAARRVAAALKRACGAIAKDIPEFADYFEKHFHCGRLCRYRP